MCGYLIVKVHTKKARPAPRVNSTGLDKNLKAYRIKQYACLASQVLSTPNTRGARLSITPIIDKLRGLFYLHSHFTILREKCQYIVLFF